MEYIKPEKISLKNHPELNEKSVQERIAEDPSLLGLGDLILKDKERIHAQAGRLDLLLQNADSTRRYEVEVQLGKTDESHIIRTIEYWDIERKRYPQYEHTAVIVAEDITSRFLNVISLFNGFIPLVAIQMQTLKLENRVLLVFTKVLDERTLGLVDADEEVSETVNREYWEQKGDKTSLAIIDELFEMVKSLDNQFSLNYTKFYIGLAKSNKAYNFALFRPRKGWAGLEFSTEQSSEIEEILKEVGLEFDYVARRGRYRIQLQKGDVKKHEVTINNLLRKAYEEFRS